jgi:hypothetical protein
MVDHNRRTFVSLSLGGLAALSAPPSLLAATQCVTGPLPGFLPNSLTVDCASKRNFRTFRQYPDYVCLAGVVSMSFVQGKLGSYPAGNLFLFPQLTAKGKGKTLPAVCPTNLTAYVNSSPIPDATLPVDDYFCRFVLQAPWTSFIGFEVGKLYSSGQNNFPWFTNVDKLADGSGVGIDWTSANLNNPWFGGSRWIPNTNTCDGTAWRKLIVKGLNQASVGACSTA